MNLLQSVANDYGPQTANAVETVFAKLCLPLPESGEFIKTGEPGYLIPLQPYGCLLRFTPSEQYPAFGNSHILQPIGTLEAGVLRADINPGVLTELNFKDTSKISKKLRDEGVEYFDTFPPTINTGWLPYRTPEFPDGYPVVIDMGALRKLSESVQSVKSVLDAGKPEPHDVLYGSLKKSFTASVATEKSEDMESFWKQCAEKKQEGVLVTSWASKDFRGLSKVSHKYAMRLLDTTDDQDRQSGNGFLRHKSPTIF